MSDRDLRTNRDTVFGDVEPGTVCRICGRDVDDGRRKTCSDYCESILRNVMALLNWGGVRRLVIDRDDATCVRCGFKREWIRRGNDYIHGLIDERLPEKPLFDYSVTDHESWDREDLHQHIEEWDEWEARQNELRNRFGNPWKDDERYGLEVDHIEPVADGGHPFDPANLQTLCRDCHNRKTALENSERTEKKQMPRPEIKLVEFAADGGDGL